MRLSIVYQIPQGRLFINFPSASVECSRIQHNGHCYLSLSNQSLRKMAHKLSKLCLLLYLLVSLYVSLQQRQPKVEILTHLMIVVFDESHSGIYLFATCSPHLPTKNIISNFHEYLTDHNGLLIFVIGFFVKRIWFVKKKGESLKFVFREHMRWSAHWFTKEDLLWQTPILSN